MLRAHALADLFAANTGDPISGIFLTTTSGHLVGLSPQAEPSSPSPALMRKLAVLCALTWRIHSAAFPRSCLSRSTPTRGSSSTDDLAAQAAKSARVQPLPILGQALDEEGALSGLAVNGEGRGENKVVSLGYVGDGLLVGVVGAGLVHAVATAASIHSKATSSNSNDDDSASEVDSDSGSNLHEAREQSHKAEQEARELGAILSVKADALATFLRDELGGFKMPKELE